MAQKILPTINREQKHKHRRDFNEKPRQVTKRITFINAKIKNLGREICSCVHWELLNLLTWRGGGVGSAGLTTTYLLTYCMVQSPSWEATWFAASQEIPPISRNPKVHYCTHKRPWPIPILGKPNPVHIPTSHLLEINPNIIHASTPRSPQWSLSLRFPHQDPIHPSLLTHTRHMPSPSHSSRFYHPHNIGWAVQII